MRPLAKLLNRYIWITGLIFLIAHMTIEVQNSKSYFDYQRVLLYILLTLTSYLITFYKIIPALIKVNIRAGLTGQDIYLKGTPEFEVKIAECLGLGTAVVYFSALVFIYGFYRAQQMIGYFNLISSVLGYVTFGTFLGFVDDVLELRWRDKLIYPFIFSILIIFNYEGDTKLHFPLFVEGWIGVDSIDISYLFYICMILLSIFCVNSINIYAGISGLEVGQSLIIGLTLMIENLICISQDDDANNNAYSVIILGPFIAVSLALLRWNRVQAKTFVGDTYCYFAGCVLAASGIISKSPVKLMLFFLPQLFNFVLSLPQLFGIVFCPRHRLPTMDLATKRMHTTFPQNLNLVNFALWVTGPINEQNLGNVLLFIQVFCNMAVIVILRLIKFKTE